MKNSATEEEKPICGKCMHHRKEEDWWICIEPSSECYGCCTEYNDSCENFEGREQYINEEKFEVVLRKNS